MRKSIVYFMALISASVLSGCGAAWQNVSYTDDLYGIHDKISIANRQKAEAELAKAQYEAQQAQYEANLARIQAEAAAQSASAAESSVSGYDLVLADSYESAYARRLYGFSSPTYRMPSSYYTLRFSSAFHYASAYDPAFYNVIVSGDMVWVEPKYVTSMFGSWGGTVLPTYNWYYGWNYSYNWYRPYYSSWYNPYYGTWYNPYYCGYYHHHHHHGYYNPYYNRHHNHHHYRPGHHYPHKRPVYRPSRPDNHRPPYAGSGSVGSTGHHNRPGQVAGRNPGASKPADRVSGTPVNGRGNQPLYRGGNSSTNQQNSGSSSYRGGSSNSGSSSYRGGTPSSGSSNSGSAGSSYRGSSTTRKKVSGSVGSSYRGSSSGSSSSGSSSSSWGRSYSSGSSSGSSSSSGGFRSSGGSGGNSRGR